MPEAPILIVGPGAIGLLTAARMLAAGHNITLLDHDPVRAARIRHISLQQEKHVADYPVTLSADPGIAAGFKNILICVKAWATRDVAQALAPHMTPETSILSIQNGLGNFEALAPIVNPRNLFIGTTSYAAVKSHENRVHPTGDGQIQIAAQPGSERARNWKIPLQKAGFRVACVPDMQKMLWTKLVMNAAINPITALYQIRNGELPQNAQAWKRATELLLESIEVAQLAGVALDSQQMLQQLREVCMRTANNQSSMLVDTIAGKKSEIDAINGAILRTAKAHGYNAKNNLATLNDFGFEYTSD